MESTQHLLAEVMRKFDQALDRNALIAKGQDVMLEKSPLDRRDGLLVEGPCEVDPANLGADDGSNGANLQ